MHGEAGRDWLMGLPKTVFELERRWEMSAGEPFPNLSYNYVAPAIRDDGTNVVLKLGFPGEPDTHREAAALSAFGGRGMVRLLASDVGFGAMLLERVAPGDSLVRARDDAEATRIIAETMVRIRTPAPPKSDFPHVRDRARGFARLRERYGGMTGPLPEELVALAERLFAELLDTTNEEYLLHGDLHHDNVLRSENGYIAIDPKGIVGDAAYEAAAIMYNPPGVSSRPNLRRVLESRISMICDVTGLEWERVLGWAQAQAVLSAVWSVEDHGEVWQEPLTVARTLRELYDAQT